jgi:hypothetical protein
VPARGVQDLQASASVDVFFVHPTTYYKRERWNQPLDDAAANQLTDLFVLRAQASVFNSCCRIYAPRYRQATSYSFMDHSGSGAAALELAYHDVERAFDYYISNYNHGRPFILAGHSQGSLHVRTLLEKRISGSALRKRLVVAYPIGWSIDAVAMAAVVPDVPVCRSAEQTSCVASWNAIGPKAERFGDTRQTICVNPLTWRADDVAAPRTLNIGAVGYAGTFQGRLADLRSLPQEFIDARPVLETAVADAQCVDGMLLVTQIHSQLYAARPMGRDNYHIYDYSLFHMNLRRNAQMRVAQFLSHHRPPTIKFSAGTAAVDSENL